METAIDPITGKRVKMADMPEHLRIQLLDPKWAEERKKFQDKQKDSNLVGGDVVANNLARLAQARGMGDVLDTEENAKKRLQDANRLLREQALDPQTKVGPTPPQPQGAEAKRPPPPPPEGLPEAKRPRVTEVLPPPPPPPGFGGFANAPSVDPFAQAATGGSGVATAASVAPMVMTTTMPTSSVTGATPNQSEAEIHGEFAPSRSDVASTASPMIQPKWRGTFTVKSYPLTVHAMSDIKSVKQELSRQHLNQMPINKIQLKLVTTGAFLNQNSATLAALNLGPTATLELLPKTRGGRK